MRSNNFRYHSFKAASANIGGENPVNDDGLSSQEQEKYLTPSLDEKYKEFEFQNDRNCYVNLRQTFLAVKLKFVKGRYYETYKI